METLAVDVHVPFDESDDLAGEGDYPLDEVVGLPAAHSLRSL